MSNADYEILRRVAEAVRERCIDEARQAFEQGGMSGLCGEGRWDLAMDRLRSLDLESIVRAALIEKPPGAY
ncbi:MAG: acetyltransferase [Nitrococcus sp.]|nr:acetyltransferase [Nitrococcus sp.]